MGVSSEETEEERLREEGDASSAAGTGERASTSPGGTRAPQDAGSEAGSGFSIRSNGRNHPGTL